MLSDGQRIFILRQKYYIFIKWRIIYCLANIGQQKIVKNNDEDDGQRQLHQPGEGKKINE
jgi:hypothetical protein